MRQLKGKEYNSFVDKYFKEWKDDIFKVTVVEHDEVLEYLVNEHYLFSVAK